MTIENQVITFNGIEYEWTYDSDAIPGRSWQWIDRNNREPPLAIIQKLNEEFLSSCVPKMREDMGRVDRLRFDQVLAAMGLAAKAPSLKPRSAKPDSPLAELGYTVKEDGPPQSERLELLRTAFLKPLACMEPWGPPGSADRLQNIVRHIEQFCHIKEKENEKAITKWKSDLTWLKQEFYDGQFQFSWPAGA